MKHFKVLERAYINNRICEPGEVVALGDDVTEIGACLLPCDEEGNELKLKLKLKPAEKTASAEDIG